VVQRAQDRVAPVAQAVAEHPLDLADPDRDPRQLGGVGVDLDAQDRIGPDPRELAGLLEDQAPPLDRLPLEVLERAERDEQEVAASAGGIEHAHPAQALEECAEDEARAVLRLRRLRDLATDSSSAVTRACIAAYSRRSGRITTGSTSCQI